MAKLRFSEDECDEDLPVCVLLERKRRRTAVGLRIGGAAQPGMSSDDGSSSSGEWDSTDSSEDETVEIVDDEPGQEVVQRLPEPGQGTSSGTVVITGAPVSLTLTDPEVLDCAICLEPLTVPVFQVCHYFITPCPFVFMLCFFCFRANCCIWMCGDLWVGFI